MKFVDEATIDVGAGNGGGDAAIAGISGLGEVNHAAGIRAGRRLPAAGGLFQAIRLKPSHTTWLNP